MEISILFSTEIKATDKNIRSTKCFKYENETYIAVGDWKGGITILKLTNNELKNIKTFKAHPTCVYTLAFRSTEISENSQIISSGSDHLIKVWEMKTILSKDNPQPLKIIDVHKRKVCYTQITPDGYLLSSSWDKTLCLTDIETHEKREIYKYKEYIIWATRFLDGFLFCCADCTLTYIDKDGTVIASVLMAHDDIIRKIKCVTGSDIFYTVGDDGYLSEWKFNKETKDITKVRSLFISYEHIYALNLLNTQIVVGGEDHIVYIVDKRQFTIKDAFPVSSNIWTLAYLPNHDLCIATEDGYIRIFTKSLTRRAPQDEQKKFLDSIADTIMWIPSVENADIEEFPTSTDNLEKTPGRFFTIRDGNDIAIMIYSKGYHSWVRVGKVHRETKKVVDENSNVFDAKVTIHPKDGQSIDLYLNYTDDPANLALDFIEKYNLSQDMQTVIETTILAQCGDMMIQSEKDHTEKSGVFGNLSYGIADMCGRRETMEDRNFAFSEGKGIATFGLFDGHGGTGASSYAAECLPKMIRARRNNDNFYINILEDIQSTMKEKYITEGTTALIASFANGLLSVANLGDTRCVLCRQTPVRMSFDHRVTVESEMEFIKSRGGEIKRDRIGGALAVSRVLGDGFFARFLNPKPFYKEERLTPGDRVVLACDGVWDVMSDEEVSEIVRESTNPLTAAKNIRLQAYERMSGDNISVIVVFTKCD